MTTSRHVAYAGSFNPPILDYLWMIQEVQSLSDELIVAIDTNPEKRSTYIIEGRRIMFDAIIHPLPNAHISVLENHFLVDYTRGVSANFIVRGIRPVVDYGYERSMHHVSSDTVLEISTTFLMPLCEIAEVSSTMVKGLIGPQGQRDMIGRYPSDPVYQKTLQNYETST